MAGVPAHVRALHEECESWSRAALGSRRPCENSEVLLPIRIRLSDLQDNRTLGYVLKELLQHHIACGRDYTGDSAANISSEGTLNLPRPKLHVSYVTNKIMLYCSDIEMTKAVSKVEFNIRVCLSCY